MQELRRDPVVDRWVIISAQRAARPVTVSGSEQVKAGGFCPFCEGNESSTPDEVYALRDNGSPPNGPGWRLRVVPNKFPALARQGELIVSNEGMYDRMSGVGVHEVLIETSDHNLPLAALPSGRIADLFQAVRHRFCEFKKDKKIKCAQFFKNHGFQAGASIEHSHSQIIAMPVVSKLLKEELFGAEKYYRRENRCVYCDMIDMETSARVRVVMENKDFIALAPYASRFAYETLLLPKKHNHRFEDTGEDTINALADILKKLLQNTNSILGHPPYNLMLHTFSFGQGADADGYYHWHVELLPMVNRVAGFEWGAGFFINPVPPEEAAKSLRGA